MVESKSFVEDMSVLILTGNQRRHRYFVNSLCRKFEVRGVISETVRVQPRPTRRSELDDVECHFTQRDNKEYEYFPRENEFNIDSCDLISIEKGNINSPIVSKWISDRDPKYLLLYGCGIVKERLLTKFSDRVINMHLGLSPYYRGSGTNFWPLVNREPELIGTTIHIATLEVDGGPILQQVRPTINLNDGCHDIGCKAIIEGVECVASAVREYDEGQRVPVSQKNMGREYGIRDFNVHSVRKMWDNFETGMVEEYLDDMVSRTDNWPIIS
tara:strand:- start:10677 stop:11489 length:813 start_codon:yes stop_codon:yes gene_type:complete